MTFAVLESGVAIVTLLALMEMRHQRRPWRSALITVLSMFTALTAMVVMWRGR